MQLPSRGFTMPGSNFLEDAAGNFLQLAKASEVILKIGG